MLTGFTEQGITTLDEIPIIKLDKNGSFWTFNRNFRILSKF